MVNLSLGYSCPDYLTEQLILQGECDRGIQVDSRLAELCCEYEKIALIWQKRLAEFGIKSANSAKELTEYFKFRPAAGYILGNNKSKGGNYSFSDGVLAVLYEYGYVEAGVIQEARTAIRLAASIKTLLGCVVDGKVHPELSITKTNRVAYKNPGLLTYPKDMLWKALAPSTPECSLYSIDIAQQEPTIIANMLGVKELTDESLSSDFYERIYLAACGKKPTDEQRAEIKTVWNALTYGSSKAALVNRCKLIDAASIHDYFHSIEKFREWQTKAKASGRRGEQQIITLFGTPIYADEAGKKLGRCHMNLVIQGTASDILALLVTSFTQIVEKNKAQDCMRILFTRYDEIIVEVNEQECVRRGYDVNFILHDMFEHRVVEWAAPFKVHIDKIK